MREVRDFAGEKVEVVTSVALSSKAAAAAAKRKADMQVRDACTGLHTTRSVIETERESEGGRERDRVALSLHAMKEGITHVQECASSAVR